MFPQNVVNHSQVFTVSQPTIPQSKKSPRGKHENIYSYSSSSQIKDWGLFQVLEILRLSYQSTFQLSSAASSPRNLTYDRSIASSKASSPHSAI